MSDLTGLHFINVGTHGTFTPTGDFHTTPADIDAIIAHLESTDAKKLTLHFHGGLIKESAGVAIAAKMAPLYTSAGSHPATFVWETGFAETVLRNLDSIRRTGLFKKLIKYAIRYAAKRLGGGIGGKGPGEAMSIDEIEEELRGEGAFEQFDAGARGGAAQITADELEAMEEEVRAELEEELEADEELGEMIRSEAPATPLLDPSVPREAQDDGARGVGTWLVIGKKVATVVYHVVRRFVQKRDHGFYPTVVEEVLRALYIADFGAWVWGSMKEVAEQMWLPNEGLLGDKMHPGTYLLEQLAQLQQREPDLLIDVVGHSAGSVAICHLLKASFERGPSLKIRNILFLAPACRADLFVEEVVNHPDRYERFRMFTMHDEYEKKDKLVAKLYNRSLLYLVSGVLEGEADTPLAGMHRYSQGVDPFAEAPFVQLRDFLSSDDRLALSDSADSAVVGGAPVPPDMQTRSVEHGDFDDEEITRASIAAIIGS